MSLRVLEPGRLSSVQDAGRRGWQHLGVGSAGAADPLSHALANLLAGNDPAWAALECTLAGPTLRLERDLVLAFGGAPFPLRADGVELPRWRSFALRAGSRLEIGETARGLRGYLAVAGGIALPPCLGSRSTDLRGGFGGLEGRALRGGDLLPCGEPPAAVADLLAGPAPRIRNWRLPWAGALPGEAAPPALRLIPGPQWPLLTAASRQALLGEAFQVGSRSDRMGLRLEGPALALERPLEAISAPVATGTVQLPPDGGPILLLADRQTTGGYPRLGEIAAVDLPWAAQARPGTALRFRVASVQETQVAWLAQAAQLDFLRGLLAREGANPGMMG